MLTIIEVDNERCVFYARTIDASAASGELVIPGKPRDESIVHQANECLAAPDSGDYCGWTVEWEN